MSSLDLTEDDDDTFYYEVEEILDVQTTESGVRNFLIKWKNYDSSYFNTWEPEHNLNCPSILSEFLRKRKKSIQEKRLEELKAKEAKAKQKRSLTMFVNEPKGLKRTSREDSTDFEDVPIVSEESDDNGNNKNKDSTGDGVDGSQQIKKKKKKRDDEERKKKKKKKKEKKDRDKEKSKSIDSQLRIEENRPTPSWSSSSAGLSSSSSSSSRSTGLSEHRPFQSSSKATLSKDDSAFTHVKRTTTTTKPAPPPVNLDNILHKVNSQYSSVNHSPISSPTTPPATYRTPPQSPQRFESSAPLRITPQSPQRFESSVPLRITPQSPKPTHPTSKLGSPVSKVPPSAPKLMSTLPKLTSPVSKPSQIAAEPSSPRAVVPSQQLSVTVKRSTFRKDPRLVANERRLERAVSTPAAPPASTPVNITGLLKKGSALVAVVTLEGKKTCYHADQISKLIGQFKPGYHEIVISTFVPLRRLNTILKDRVVSYLKVNPKDHMIEASKLKSFMQVNEIAGVVSHPNMPTEALIIMSDTDIRKLTNCSDFGLLPSLYSNMCALFIDGLPPQPKVCLQDLDIVDTDTESMYTWNRTAKYLNLPAQLKELRGISNFIIYGNSEASDLLKRACMTTKPLKKPTGTQPVHVMMFDRFHNMLLTKSLTKHKREPSTQIWEFGAPDFYYKEIEPAHQVFPKFSGGFVTTDAANLIANPSIVEEISAQVKKFNQIPIMYGEWKFILPYNIFEHLKKAIKEDTSREKVQSVCAVLSVALSNGTVEIIRLWSNEADNGRVTKYMENILKSYCKTRQYFVIADDVQSIPSQKKEKHVYLDFVESKNIFKSFCQRET